MAVQNLQIRKTIKKSSSFSLMALQSKTDLRLLNGLHPVRSTFWLLFPICNFAFITTCLYKIPPMFGHCLSGLPWEILLNNWFTFLSLTILLTRPIQSNRLILTNESISQSSNICINSLLNRFLLFSFSSILSNILLKTFLSKAVSLLTMFQFSAQHPAPHVAAGLINVLPVFIFSALSTNWLCSRCRSAWYALFAFVILFSIPGLN